MGALKPGERAARLREAETIHAAYGDTLNCAERVFLTLHRLMETDIPAEAVSMLTGLGGGVGGTRDNTCGAITGGVAALGLAHGRRTPPAGDRLWTYEVSRDFVSRFRTAFGETVCNDLVGDLLRQATPEAEQLRKARCMQLTLAAIRMALETLERHGDRPSSGAA
jgi:C_GCAxxG_C_C family probable redox protein